jgi:dehydrogenase/reductase SDR family member 1
MRSLHGKVALITGASRGIGKGVALELAKAGATVYLTSRNKSKATTGIPGTAEEVVRQVTALGGRGVALSCDHADDAQTRAVMAEIQRAEGRLDILVNNAMATVEGMPGAGPLSGGVPFWQAPLESWDIATNVGLRSHYAATVLAMPMLIESAGLVVNISAAGAEIYYLSVPYGIQKCGTDRMIRDMAFEAAELPVTFVALWPGLVMTELVAGLTEDQLKVAHDSARRFTRDALVRQGRSLLAVQEPVKAESQAFPGMAVAALACDPVVHRKNGRTLTTVGCAVEYGYRDVDGSLPDSFGFLDTSVWTMLDRAVT